MAIQNQIKIKQILSRIPAKTVVTAKQLAAMGVNHVLVSDYEKLGWFKRIANGAYTRMQEDANLDGALFALQHGDMPTIHVGGSTALNDYYGKLHFVKVGVKKQLFTSLSKRVPAWFTKVYGSGVGVTYTDFLPSGLGLQERKNDNFMVLVSSMERALFEMLYLVPTKVSVAEAYAIMETVQSVRVHLVQEMLEKCRSVKVKRLFLCFAENAYMQWFSALDLSRVDLGSGVRKIGKKGILYPRYNLVIPKLGEI